MKTWKKYLLLLIISLVQITFLPYPNLVLFFVLIDRSLVIALLGGFILDFFSPWLFGINMIAFMLLVLLFSFLIRKIIRPNYIYYVIVGIISICYNFLFNALIY